MLRYSNEKSDKDKRRDEFISPTKLKGLIMDKDEVIELTKEALYILEEYVSNGLPGAHLKFKDILTDWYYGLPWIERESICAFEFLTSDSEAARIAALVLEKFEYDLMTEWRIYTINK